MSERQTPPADPTSATGERAGPPADVIHADRACVSCGFNLYGQTIRREPHYGLLLARCPECGTPVALQEYPALGRWAQRWTALAAAAWLLVLFAAAGGFIAIIASLGISMADDFAHPLAQVIIESYADEWQGANALPSLGPWTALDSDWATSADYARIVADAGGIGAHIRNEFWLLTAILSCVSFVFGVFWSVVLLHARRARLVVTIVLLFAIIGAVDATSVRSHAPASTGQYNTARQIAFWLAGPTILLRLHGLTALACVAGALAGRPLTRLAVVALLPPRLRVPLSVLWITDGKDLPRWSRTRAPRPLPEPPPPTPCPEEAGRTPPAPAGGGPGPPPAS